MMGVGVILILTLMLVVVVMVVQMVGWEEEGVMVTAAHPSLKSWTPPFEAGKFD